MDCRTCEPTLIDLVHDELATDAAAEAREHLAQCTSCRASFERLVGAQRLASELPLQTPPQAVSARLLQIAEARAAAVRAQNAPKTAPPSLVRRLLDFVASFAMGRQVGMATIMLLIVAVGLWSLPRMRHEPEAAGTVVDADGEAAPTPGLEPASPLDLKVDPRARRIRSKGDQEAEPALAATEEGVQPASAAALEKSAAAERTDKGSADDPLRQLDDLDGLLLGEAKKEGADESVASARGHALEGAGSGLADEARSLERAAGPQAFPASPAAESELDLHAGRDVGLEAPPTTKAKTAAPRPRAAMQAPAEGAPEPAAAPSPYRTGSTSSVPSSGATLLSAARAVARSSGCIAALPRYEQVVRAAPGSADAGSALIEMAQCRRNQGQTAEAQRLLERAAAIPATAARARSLMAQTEAAESR